MKTADVNQVMRYSSSCYLSFFIHAYIFHYGNYMTKTRLTERTEIDYHILRRLCCLLRCIKKKCKFQLFWIIWNTSNGITAQIWAVSCLKLILFLSNTWKHSASSLHGHWWAPHHHLHTVACPNNQKKNAVNSNLTYLALKVLAEITAGWKRARLFVDWVIRLGLSLNCQNVCGGRASVWRDRQ